MPWHASITASGPRAAQAYPSPRQSSAMTNLVTPGGHWPSAAKIMYRSPCRLLSGPSFLGLKSASLAMSSGRP
eukprot:1207587-Pyramimonas_sp.AAC.1